MWMRTGTALLVAIAAGGCTPQPAAVQAAVSEKVYAMSPDTIKVASGLISGELTEMKVTEQVEAGSGKVTTPAKLTGKLVLKNVSRTRPCASWAGSSITSTCRASRSSSRRTAPSRRCA